LRSFQSDDEQKKQLRKGQWVVVGVEQSELYRAPRFFLSQPMLQQSCARNFWWAAWQGKL
jgi:hypothetical protein